MLPPEFNSLKTDHDIPPEFNSLKTCNNYIPNLTPC